MENFAISLIYNPDPKVLTLYSENGEMLASINLGDGRSEKSYFGTTISNQFDTDGIEQAIRRIVREEIAAHEERPCSEIASNKKPYYGVEVKP